MNQEILDLRIHTSHLYLTGSISGTTSLGLTLGLLLQNYSFFWNSMFLEPGVEIDLKVLVNKKHI